MNLLRKCFWILAVLLLVFLSGDFFNWPLWPVDWLVPSFPIEIHLEFEDVSDGEKKRILEKAHYLDFSLFTAQGKFIRNLNVDDRGIARCVVEEGYYSFGASIPVIENNDWYFYIFPADGNIPSTSRQIQKNDHAFSLKLQKSRNVSGNALETIFRMFLLNANMEAALVIAGDLSAEKKSDVEILTQIACKVEELPVNSYNSMIDHLAKASDILTRNGIELHHQMLKFDNEFVYIESRRQAIREARDRVIGSCVEIMKEFQSSGQLIDVLEEWNQMTQDSELYYPGMPVGAETNVDLETLGKVVENVMKMIPDEIRTNLDMAISVYESGDLVDSRSRFMRLLSFIRNMGLSDDYANLEFMIKEYLEDIEIIYKANHEVRSDNLETAVKLYDMVSHPNAIVNERKLEMVGLLKLRGREELY